MWYNITVNGEEKEYPYYLKDGIFYRHQIGEKIPIDGVETYDLCMSNRGKMLNHLIKMSE